MRSALLLSSSLVLLIAGCDGCVEPPGVEGDTPPTREGEGEGEANEGEGEVVGEGEGEGAEGEGEGEGAEGEGEGVVGEGEGEGGVVGEGEGEGGVGEGEGEGGVVGEGEGEGGVVGEGEGEGVDPGHGFGDVFVEIDYSFADAPERPAFRYSNTPGFQAEQWSYNDPFGGGLGTPDAWDRFNNMEVINDFRLGRVLAVGSGNRELQLMLGLPSFVSYETVLVEIDGDEEAHSGVARYDVYNPLVMEGAFSDPDAVTDGIGRHVKVLDLGPCLIPGEQVQAIRLDPQTGVVGLKRMRVTLVNARW